MGIVAHTRTYTTGTSLLCYLCGSYNVGNETSSSHGDRAKAKSWSLFRLYLLWRRCHPEKAVRDSWRCDSWKQSYIYSISFLTKVQLSNIGIYPKNKMTFNLLFKKSTFSTSTHQEKNILKWRDFPPVQQKSSRAWSSLSVCCLPANCFPKPMFSNYFQKPMFFKVIISEKMYVRIPFVRSFFSKISKPYVWTHVFIFENSEKVFLQLNSFGITK